MSLLQHAGSFHQTNVCGATLGLNGDALPQLLYPVDEITCRWFRHPAYKWSTDKNVELPYGT
jgi:hypothetical protein